MYFDPQDPDSIVDYVISPEGRHEQILDVIALLKDAYSRHPEHFGVAHQLAVHCSKGFSRQDNDALAEEAFERALELAPDDYMNFNEFCRFLKKKDRHEEAEELCLDWLEDCEENSFDEAMTYKTLAALYISWAKIQPEDWETIFSLARAAAHIAQDIMPDDPKILDIYQEAKFESGLSFDVSDLDTLEARILSFYEENDENDHGQTSQPEPGF